MTCNAVKKKKTHSNNRQLEFVMNAVAYSMFESGKTQEDVQQMLDRIEYFAELFVDDYITFLDVRKVLKNEYGFELRFND